MIELTQQTSTLLSTGAALLSAIAASIGLLYSGRAAISQAKATDVQTILRLIDELARYSTSIKEAGNDEDLRHWRIVEWLNHVEVLTALFLGNRFEKVTRRLVYELLIDACYSIRFTDSVKRTFEASIVNEHTYEELRKFTRKNLSEICRRRYES